MKKSKKAIAILGLSAIMLLTTKKVAYAETYQITYNVAEYNHSSLKSYESYTVFDENYDQYELQEMAVTDENGFRMINGNYLVAIGSKFGVKIGQYFDLTLENGTVIHCIMGDQKADIDTDVNNLYTDNGCMSEFIVDISKLDSTVKTMGDCSYICEEWNSRVVSITVYSWNILNGKYIGYWD